MCINSDVVGADRDKVIAAREGATNFQHSGLSGFWYADFPEGKCLGVPQYSTDIGAAWALLMRLPSNYTPRLVRMLSPRGDKMGYVNLASILENDGQHRNWAAEADDAADAMSTVWLMWDTDMQVTP